MDAEVEECEVEQAGGMEVKEAGRRWRDADSASIG